MKTRAGMKKFLADLIVEMDLPDEVSEKLREISADYETAIGYIAELGDVPEDEDTMDFEFVRRKSPDWESKYNELKRQYTERFFSAPPITTAEKVVDKAEDDATRDSEDMTFDELLTKREG